MESECIGTVSGPVTQITGIWYFLVCCFLVLLENICYDLCIHEDYIASVHAELSYEHGFSKEIFFVEVDEVYFKVTLACDDDAHKVIFNV